MSDSTQGPPVHIIGIFKATVIEQGISFQFIIHSASSETQIQNVRNVRVAMQLGADSEAPAQLLDRLFSISFHLPLILLPPVFYQLIALDLIIARAEQLPAVSDPFCVFVAGNREVRHISCQHE